MLLILLQDSAMDTLLPMYLKLVANMDRVARGTFEIARLSAETLLKLENFQ